MSRYLIGMMLLASLCSRAQAEEARQFESFAVKQHGVADAPEFVYSKAAATAEDPVVISVTGRALVPEDREFRTDLQKHWIATQVPKGYRFVSRVLVSCDRGLPAAEGLCDEYAFQGPDGTHRYLFYVSHWP